uniref:glycerophosphodiester phosphodiesterase n=1 Tax=Oryza barthii TaxID=65489 RepID=A0A0D3HU87_9ORYZ
MLSYRWILLLSVVVVVAVAAELPLASTTFKTLTGNAPLVIARGGFSGLFPDSSQFAFGFALSATSTDTSLWCDVQLTKDGVGFCLRDLLMQNGTTISQVYPGGKQTYRINGVPKTGWFPVDYNMSLLTNYSHLPLGSNTGTSRTDKFDFCNFRIFSVTGFMSSIEPSSLWLNVEHDVFYTEHGLNMTNYILSVQKLGFVKYISSPELGFLETLSGGIDHKVKLVFRFLDKAVSDPSTNKTYDSMLNDLAFIKTIASGIMVPKSYIWPVTSENYIQLPTQIVKDAHDAGLEIYASDFSNDGNFPYNYGYDPLEEYLSFVSNGGFSVDGVLTDHPLTASEAIGNILIISHNGASGDYPDCTDLAYEKAVGDGADVIDCSIEMTKDGIPICMSSINLYDQNSKFSSLASVVPEIQTKPGIFTFNLTWEEISTLRPKITHPYHDFVRNPKDKDLSGIMIIMKNAAFMAKSLGFDVVDLVTTALSNAGYDNMDPTTKNNKEIMIQSKDSAVLVKLKQRLTQCKLVYSLPLKVGDVSDSCVADIKKFADAVIVDRESVFAESKGFIIRKSKVVEDVQSAGLALYVEVFRNEYVSSPVDFFADGTVEINNYVQLQVPIGDLAQLLDAECSTGGMLPALAPMPVLNSSDVIEPPLPAAEPKSAAGSSATNACVVGVLAPPPLFSSSREYVLLATLLLLQML